MKVRVAIVGGGLAGFFTASELQAAGVDDVVVLDRNDQPGGVARTVKRDGYELEPAAGALLLPKPDLSPVLEHLGAEIVPAVDAALRYVYARGRLNVLRPSPTVVFSPVVSWPAKFRALAEPFIRTKAASSDESLDAFLRRRFGNGMGGTLAWLAASGVFAGDPARMSARSAFPAFPALEDEAGSLVRGGIRRARSRERGAERAKSHVPVGGVSALAERAADKLGDRYRPGVTIESVRPGTGSWEIKGSDDWEAEHVVLAVRPSHASPLVGGELAAVLDRAVSAPAVVVGLGAESKRLPLPPGFGALTGPDAGTISLGVLFESSYAPERAPAGHSLAKVIAGGANHREVMEWDDDRIIDRVQSEVGKILSIEPDPSFVHLIRHTTGIPQYEPGHGGWLAEVDALCDPGLHLTGWGYRGVGVGHIATDAVRIATEIAGAGSVS